ncbi:protein of unknown function DUF1555 [Maridesulfovibrio salexigens DSM 2638]|uniref:VPLPA-CTERM protein sorting domain-containing protein n=2 Tax=Maridesulfovibrio salexigens TaxID=880 RepID=C6BY72_MARSD|nr:protein of unknown function DUF1555 [Maridesulfovibrio salexigens DSM 2638]
MKNLIFITLISLFIAASGAQAATINGWAHSDNISADIYTTYSASESSLLLTVTNTSPATSAYLSGLLFSASGATLNLREVAYYSDSISTSPLNVTDNWSQGTPASALLNSQPMKYLEGLDTTIFTGSDFLGGSPNDALPIGWTANFMFDVDGAYTESINNFVARFQGINYPGLTGSDSDFASSVPTPIPGAIWLLGAGLGGLAILRRRMQV